MTAGGGRSSRMDCCSIRRTRGRRSQNPLLRSGAVRGGMRRQETLRMFWSTPKARSSDEITGTAEHSLIVGQSFTSLYSDNRDKDIGGAQHFLSMPDGDEERPPEEWRRASWRAWREPRSWSGQPRELLNKSIRTSGVLARANVVLGLYRDPIVARVTSPLRLAHRRPGSRPAHPSASTLSSHHSDSAARAARVDDLTRSDWVNESLRGVGAGTSSDDAGRVRGIGRLDFLKPHSPFRPVRHRAFLICPINEPAREGIRSRTTACSTKATSHLRSPATTRGQQAHSRRGSGLATSSGQ